MMTRLERAASLAATCVLVATSAAAAEIVVIESNSPRFVAGQLLDDSAPIELAAGQSLLIVTEDGRVVRLDGPYDGPAVGPAPDAGAVRRAVERLVNAGEPRVGGVGAVRGDEDAGSGVDTRPDPWLVHAERDGEQCARNGRPLELWREDAARSIAVEVEDAVSGLAATTRWDAGAHRAVWPERIAGIDGHIYVIRLDASDRSTAVRLRILEGSVDSSPLTAAAWLAAKGCTAQAALLLR
jgi:hypothetical protein